MGNHGVAQESWGSAYRYAIVCRKTAGCLKGARYFAHNQGGEGES